MRLSAVLALISSTAAAAPTLDLPPRPDDAPGGSAIMLTLLDVSREVREERLLREISQGNMPDFLRRLVPVAVSCEASGEHHTGTIWVTPDYLSVGSDDDFIRTPMMPTTAQRIADLASATLPTRRMVDAIWRAADPQLQPQPFTPEVYEIQSPRVFLASHWVIEAQRARTGAPLGALVAGIKKDVVLAAGLAARPDRVFIFGWHHPSGEPIQPLYGGHVNWWVDYSHGIRLVASEMEVDGEPATVAEILADPVLCGLLSDEGPVPAPRYPVE